MQFALHLEPSVGVSDASQYLSLRDGVVVSQEQHKFQYVPWFFFSGSRMKCDRTAAHKNDTAIRNNEIQAVTEPRAEKSSTAACEKNATGSKYVSFVLRNFYMQLDVLAIGSNW